MPASQGVRGSKFRNGSGEAHGAPVATGSGTQIDHVIGNLDHLGFVLNNQHGVALIPKLLQELQHVLNVVGMQPNGGFIKHVGHVCQCTAKMPNHLGPLRLTPGKRPGASRHREVSESHINEGIENHGEGGHQWSHGRIVYRLHPCARLIDLHIAHVRDGHSANEG